MKLTRDTLTTILAATLTVELAVTLLSLSYCDPLVSLIAGSALITSFIMGIGVIIGYDLNEIKVSPTTNSSPYLKQSCAAGSYLSVTTRDMKTIWCLNRAR